MEIGMAFAIIFTMIIIGFLFAVGFSQIQDFFCIGNTAQTNKAVKNIESLADEVGLLSVGSGKSFKLSLPRDTTLCFINKTDPRIRPYTDTTKTWNPDSLILEQFLSNPNSSSYQSNLWMTYCGNSFGISYNIRYLSPSKSFCAVSGRELYIENKGATVDISIRK